MAATATTAYSAVRRYSLRFDRGSDYIPNATLLTRRHVFQVKHNRAPQGSGVVHVSRDSRREVRRVIDWQPVGNCDTNDFHWTNDCIVIQQLDKPLPQEFEPLKLLPPDARQYFGDFTPMIVGHHFKKFGIVNMVDRPFLAQGFTNIFYPFGNDRPEWFVQTVGGDCQTSDSKRAVPGLTTDPSKSEDLPVKNNYVDAPRRTLVGSRSPSAFRQLPHLKNVGSIRSDRSDDTSEIKHSTR